MKSSRRGPRGLHLLLAAAAVAALLSLASCGAKATSFASLVPADAFLLGYAQDPAALLSNADEFIKAIGMEAALGGAKAEDLAFGQLGAMDIDPEEVKPLLDLSRPSGFYASGTGFKDMEPVILIAVKDVAKARAWVAENLGDGMRIDGGKGYLAFSPSGRDFSWPPATPLAAGTVPERGPGRIVVALDYGRLAKDPLMSEALEEAYGEMEALSGTMKDMLASMGWMSFQLGLDGKVLSLGTTMAFDPSTEYGKLIRAVKYGKPSMAGELSTEEIMGWAANAELTDMDAYMSYLKTLAAAFKLDIGGMEEAMRALVKAGGSDGFFSMDFSPEPGLKDLEGPQFISGLGLSMKGRASLRDEKAFRSALDGFLQSVSAIATGALKTALAGEGGPGFSFSFETKKDQAGESLSYDSHSLTLDVEGLDDDEKGMIAAFTEAFGIKVAYAKGQALIAMGADSPARLASLATGGKPASPLSAASGYADVRAALGKEPSMLLHISLARLINKMAPLGGVDMKVEENVPGLLMGAGMEGNLYVMDAALSAPELKSYIGQAFPLIMQMFTRQKSFDYDDGYGDYGFEEGNEGFNYDALEEYEGGYEGGYDESLDEGYIIPEYPDDAGYGD